MLLATTDRSLALLASVRSKAQLLQFFPHLSSSPPLTRIQTLSDTICHNNAFFVEQLTFLKSHMSDTCIVCLGDLNKGSDESASLSNSLAKSPRQDGNDPNSNDPRACDVNTSATNTTTTVIKQEDINDIPESEIIAHLQPCGHDLHNECLTPWVERANSCPICRQSFHLVELCNVVGGKSAVTHPHSLFTNIAPGPVTSSYTVEDRTQVADLDPSMFLEVPDEDDDDQPCQACGEDDNENLLMFCDGCNKLWHTYCVDLQEVPYGHWFCDQCRAHRETDSRPLRSSRSARPSRRRTRGQQRRQRAQFVAHDAGWQSVWQSVWDRLHVDLDFPFDDDETSATYLRRHRARNESNRQAHDAWQRRMHVAELQGAGGSFRETEPALLEHRTQSLPNTTRSRKRSAEPEAQTPDEAAAWQAFDQARATDSSPAGRKRKSRIPEQPTPEPEAESGPVIVKRRRIADYRSAISSSGAGAAHSRPRSPPRSPPRRLAPVDATGPSFLQSLLQEVEDSSTTSINGPIGRPPYSAHSPPAEQHSPQPSSPALSPLPSNHSSPRAMSATPPPLAAMRPSSPIGLSSSIQPVFPPTEYSPQRSSPEPRDTPSDLGQQQIDSNATASAFLRIAQPRPRSRVPRMLQHASPPQRPRSNDTSPTRPTLSYTAKADVQKLVSAALKPHYNEQKISKDEYTAINRDISRMLYDQIGEFEALDVSGKAKWEKVAGEEVNKAIGALKASAQVSVSSS